MKLQLVQFHPKPKQDIGDWTMLSSFWECIKILGKQNLGYLDTL